MVEFKQQESCFYNVVSRITVPALVSSCEGGVVVVPSMVVTDMMGEMDQDMLSLNTPLTPSLTDYTVSSQCRVTPPQHYQSHLLSPYTPVLYDEAKSASFCSSDNAETNC